MDGPRQAGAKIRQERQRRGWKTNHLARLADCRPNTLSHIEAERALASIELLHRVAAALKVPYESLLSEAGAAEWATLTTDSSPAVGPAVEDAPVPVVAPPDAPGAGAPDDDAAEVA